MNIATPVVYVDKDKNEWAGLIVGRMWQHHQPLDEKNQPAGPIERNELGTFNLLCFSHDGHSRYFADVPADDLEVADLSHEPPVFDTKALRRAPAYGSAAPAVPNVQDIVNAAVAAALRSFQPPAPPAPPPAPLVAVDQGVDDYAAFKAWQALQRK